MKKLLFLLSLCLTSSAFATTLFEQSIEAAVQEKVKEAQPARVESSAGSYFRGVIPVKLVVQSSFVKTQLINEVEKPCTAVRIAPDYLLVGAACAGSRTEGFRAGHGKTKLDYHRVASVVLFDQEIFSEKTENGSYFLPSWGNNVILIKLGNDKEGRIVKKHVSPLPIPNLFIPKSPAKSLLSSEEHRNPFFSLITAKKHRSIGWAIREEIITFDNGDAEREIVAVDTKLKQFDVSPDIVSGQPVFGLSRQKNEEFLLGFGSEPVIYHRRKNGEAYYLTDSLMAFLQQHMDKDSYALVVNKKVDESYFK